jgi:geranylgeranyl diphosphate synthase type II
MYARTTEGQHIELGWAQNHKWDIRENDYYNMCQRKTAWYTCISPSWIGALTAGVDDNLRDAFIEFGRDLGVAFQIQDDILNLIGDTEKYGKEIGGDILEGKRTLVLIHLLENCAKAERDFISSSIDVVRKNKDIGVIGDVIKLMRKYGSIDYAASVSHELAGRARDTYFKSIDSHVDDQYRMLIIDFINFMVEREL